MAVIMSGQVFVSKMGALRASGRGTFSCAALLAFLSIVGFGLAAERDYDYYASQSRIRLEPEVHVFTSSKWFQGRRVSDNDVVHVQFMLRHAPEALKRLETSLYEVSDPQHERYGAHLSVDDVTALLDLDPRHAWKVQDMLRAYGVEDKNVKVNRNRDVVSASIPALVAEELFGARLYHYHHHMVNEVDIIRASHGGYSLPVAVAPLVSMVADLIRFPHHRKHKVVEPDTTAAQLAPESPFMSCGVGCNGYTTPEVLAQRYTFPSIDKVATLNSMAVAEFQLQFWDTRDLNAFASTCDLSEIAVAQTIGRNVERACRLFDCVESLLDIEYINAVASPIPLTVYYSGTYSLLDWITAVNEDDDAPLVHSVSYGNDEAQQTSEEYMTSANTEFMKAGVRGISILFASGDQGVWGREGTSTGTFNPDFPAGSPYITSVGGTDFQEESVVGEEVVWSGSGGGFSDSFSIPSYQTDAVATYLKVAADTLPPAKLWNDSGRGYPDVSALAGQVNPYCIAYGGKGALGGVAGTSAASPTVAGVFAQLNNLRLQAGKPPLGFLNPFIYQNPQAFNDVTLGINNDDAEYGFAAAKGWDPASGVGTPNYEALAKLV